ncbi:MAG: DUF2905 domain-containing protein [Verrucomicrobiota bacterium]|nr:DUF2905 domain-containing protein [Verrucomicrobiota bacterium]
MISRFLTLAIFLMVATGIALHFEVEIPWFSSWIGHLPGDLILKKGKAIIFLPFTTSFILSGLLTALGSLFKK